MRSSRLSTLTFVITPPSLCRTAGHERIINSRLMRLGLGWTVQLFCRKAGIIGLTLPRPGTRPLRRDLQCYLSAAATRMTLNDKVIDGMKRRLDNGLISQAQYDNFMSMPGPEFVAPIVAYLATDQAADVNGQVFHAEKGRLHVLLRRRGHHLQAE